MLSILKHFAANENSSNKAINSIQDNLNNLKLDANADLIGTIGTVINTMVGLVGIVATIMLVIGGFRYATAGANEKNVTNARNQIMYAIIGIVITLVAYGATQFVLTALK